MKTIDFDNYRKSRNGFIRKRAELDAQRTASRRPRDGDERRLLLELDRKRWQQWLESGKIRRDAPRSYRLR